MGGPSVADRPTPFCCIRLRQGWQVLVTHLFEGMHSGFYLHNMYAHPGLPSGVLELGLLGVMTRPGNSSEVDNSGQ